MYKHTALLKQQPLHHYLCACAVHVTFLFEQLVLFTLAFCSCLSFFFFQKALIECVLGHSVIQNINDCVFYYTAAYLAVESRIGRKSKLFLMPPWMRVINGFFAFMCLLLVIDTLVNATCFHEPCNEKVISNQAWRFLQAIFTPLLVGTYFQFFAMFIHIALDKYDKNNSNSKKNSSSTDRSNNPKQGSDDDEKENFWKAMKDIYSGFCVLVPITIALLCCGYSYMQKEELVHYIKIIQIFLHCLIIVISVLLLAGTRCTPAMSEQQQNERNRCERVGDKICTFLKWMFLGDPERLVYLLYFVLGGVVYNCFAIITYSDYGKHLDSTEQENIGIAEKTLGLISSISEFIVIIYFKLKSDEHLSSTPGQDPPSQGPTSQNPADPDIPAGSQDPNSQNSAAAEVPTADNQDPAANGIPADSKISDGSQGSNSQNPADPDIPAGSKDPNSENSAAAKVPTADNQDPAATIYKKSTRTLLLMLLLAVTVSLAIADVLKDESNKDEHTFVKVKSSLHKPFEIFRPIVVDFRVHNIIILACIIWEFRQEQKQSRYTRRSGVRANSRQGKSEHTTRKGTEKHKKDSLSSEDLLLSKDNTTDYGTSTTTAL